jgi:hypothetical protein
MNRKIAIDPITRVEGHGKVTLHLDENNRVKEARFHIVEFRGFESFVKGHPYWEAPLLVQRLCGICPVSHHLAAGKAVDQVVGIDPEDLPPTATKIRRLLHYAQVFQSHATHFFYLASPDLLFGTETPPENRNIMEVAVANPDLARKRHTNAEIRAGADTGNCREKNSWDRRNAGRSAQGIKQGGTTVFPGRQSPAFHSYDDRMGRGHDPVPERVPGKTPGMDG